MAAISNASVAKIVAPQRRNVAAASISMASAVASMA